MRCLPASHIKDKLENQTANTLDPNQHPLKRRLRQRPKFRLSKHQTFCKGAFGPCNYVFKKQTLSPWHVLKASVYPPQSL